MTQKHTIPTSVVARVPSPHSHTHTHTHKPTHMLRAHRTKGIVAGSPTPTFRWTYCKAANLSNVYQYIFTSLSGEGHLKANFINAQALRLSELPNFNTTVNPSTCEMYSKTGGQAGTRATSISPLKSSTHLSVFLGRCSTSTSSSQVCWVSSSIGPVVAYPLPCAAVTRLVHRPPSGWVGRASSSARTKTAALATRGGRIPSLHI